MLTTAGLAIAGALPSIAMAQDKTLSAQDARSLGKEVFLWGMHPVAIYHVRYNAAQNEQSPAYVGINRLRWYRKPIVASDRFATTPNATTLYGVAMLDLSKEPVVVFVPEIRDHYWSIQFADNYARWWPMMIGSQFNAPGQVKRLLIGPTWKGRMPAGFVGAEITQAPSDFAVATARVALTDDTPEELRLVNGIQDGVTLMSLSTWEAAGRKPVRAEDVPVAKGNYPTYPGMESVKEPGKLTGVDFLRWVSLVLNDESFTKQGDGYHERMAFERFEHIGLKAGLAFDASKLSPAVTAAIAEGIEDGRTEALALMARGSGVERNGWGLSSDLGYKDSDWVDRARYGLIAVLGPVPPSSHTGAFCLKDSQGRPLAGEHRYTITFDLNNLPPVTEFWEIPLYDRAGYFADNPINRYSINRYLLTRGKLHTEGGKLVIYVQSDEPAAAGQRKN
jgi:hypothetical protein